MKLKVQHKLDLMLPWISNYRILDAEIVDVGCNNAALLSELKKRHYENLSGVDYNSTNLSIARQNPETKDIKLICQDACELNIKLADVIIYSSILHEVYSYKGLDLSFVEKALEKAYENIHEGGRILIRDFIKPYNHEEDVKVIHHFNQSHGLFHEFRDKFVAPIKMDSFILRGNTSSIDTNMGGIYEYMFHKDYWPDWDRELKEVYGFWTKEWLISTLQKIGFKITHVELLDNNWITENRLKDKVTILDKQGKLLPYPKYQIFVVAEK